MNGESRMISQSASLTRTGGAGAFQEHFVSLGFHLIFRPVLGFDLAGL